MQKDFLKCIAAIDQGTTSTRCLILDYEGKIISSAQKEHHQIFPSPVWVEYDPIEILSNSIKVLRKAISFSNSKINLQQIKALDITNQRETTVLWNKLTGKPYGNAIVWQNIRTEKTGLTVKFWKNIDNLRLYWKEDRRWLPKMQGSQRENLYYDWKRTVECSFGWNETR